MAKPAYPRSNGRDACVTLFCMDQLRFQEHIQFFVEFFRIFQEKAVPTAGEDD